MTTRLRIQVKINESVSDIDDRHYKWAVEYADRLVSGGLDENQAINTACNQILNLESDYYQKRERHIMYMDEGHNCWIPLTDLVPDYFDDLQNGGSDTLDVSCRYFSKSEFNTLADAT